MRLSDLVGLVRVRRPPPPHAAWRLARCYSLDAVELRPDV